MREHKILFLSLLMFLLCYPVMVPAFARTDDVPIKNINTSWAETEPISDSQQSEAKPLTPDGNMTLIDDDKVTSANSKQFVTVTSKNGNYFYLIIDHDKNGEENVHFLNQVDETDLLAIIDTGENLPPSCSCTTKCHAGAVNIYCDICAVNMSECVGRVPEPTPEPEPEVPKEPEPEPQKNGTNPLFPFLLLIATAGGGAFYCLKYKKTKPKVSGSDDLSEYDYGEDDEEEFGTDNDEDESDGDR